MKTNPTPNQPSPSEDDSLVAGSGWELVRVERRGSLDALEREVLAAGGRPMDHWEVAARLESFGLNDQTAQKYFQLENVFTLASVLFDRIGRSPAPVPPLVQPETNQPKRLVQDFARFGRALSFALPWGLLFVNEHVIGAQLPIERRLTPESAAVFSVAIMLSLIVSGGFVQVMARRGLFYQGMKEPALERAMLVLFLKLGGLVSFLAAGGGTLLGFYAGWVSDPAILLGAGCFVVLCGLWLCCGVLTVRASAWPVVLIFCGSITTYMGLVSFTETTAVTAQMASFGVACLAAVGYTWRSLAQVDIEEVPESLPDMGVLAYLLAPYFLSGLGYFTFLFTDRWLAGTVFTPQLGVPFMAHSDYQLGSDVALLGFFPLVGLVEVFAHRFMASVFVQAERTPLGESALFQAQVTRRFLSFALAILCAASIPIGLWIISKPEIWQQFHIPIEQAVTSRAIAVWAGIGVGAIALALFEMLVLFSFSAPWPALRALAAGCLVNWLLGYLCGSLFGYETAVCGLVAGALTWAILGWEAVRRLFSELEYRYFAM